MPDEHRGARGKFNYFLGPPGYKLPLRFHHHLSTKLGRAYYVSATGESLFDYDTTNSNGWDNVSPIFYFTMNFPGTTTSDPDPSFTFEAYSAPGGNRFPNGAADIVASYQLTYNDGSWNITAYTPTDQFAALERGRDRQWGGSAGARNGVGLVVAGGVKLAGGAGGAGADAAVAPGLRKTAPPSWTLSRSGDGGSGAA